MKKQRFSFILFFILVTISAVYLWLQCRGDNSELKVITLTGINYCYNYSRSWTGFGSLADTGEITALPVSEGDILYLFSSDGLDYPSVMRYHESDGLHLMFESDTGSPNEIFWNKELLTLHIDDEFEWMNDRFDEEIKYPRSIYFVDDSIQDHLFPVLSKIAEINPDAGILIDYDNKDLFYKIISLFKPEWMSVPATLMDTIDERFLPSFDHLELLFLIDAEFINCDFLGRLPNLESLILMEWTPSDTNYIQLAKIRNLKSLTVINTEITSLSARVLPKSLHNLYLIGSLSLTDIDQLRTLQGLRELSLLRCDTLSDISVLYEIPPLRWLSLPPKVSQESFDEILNHHKSLQGLELIGCREIEDLSSLIQLDQIKALAIDLPEINYASLRQLSNIELIVIDQDQFDESEDEIDSLKKALPETYIVPGSGLCLGSGWILLVIPFLLIMALVIRAFIK